MKLKQRPEDFVVRELVSAPPAGSGDFAVYRLQKAHIGTLEAVSRIARDWNVPRRAVGFAGLKDTHALSEQFISIRRGPQRSLQTDDYAVEFVGRDRAPMRPDRIAGNAFEITVRDLSPGDVAGFRRDLDEIAVHGLPNYFDAQRFGSVVDGEFVAEKMIAGDYEGALKLALGGRVRAHWGKWDDLMKTLPRGSDRSIVNYLRDHPTDFAGALDRMDKSLLFLLLSAYQSHLWNLELAAKVREAATDLIERKIGPARLPFFRTLAAPLSDIELPRLRLKKIKKAWFGKGSRAAVVVPRDLKLLREADDMLNRGRRAAAFSCEMPRGSYATLIIRRAFGTWKRGVSLD